MSATVLHGDCLELLETLEAASVDAIVTDPPYGLEFMGRDWDTFRVGRAAKYAAGGELDRDGIARRSGRGGAGPVYVKRPAKRCAACGKQAWSGSPCVCETPQWEIDNSPLRAFGAWSEEWARAALRVAKPGAHLVAFGGSRTFHRLASAIEDAGWEVRDCLMWLYGSGFPKSLDVSKAIDKAAGAVRDKVQPGNPPAYQRRIGNHRPWMDNPNHVIDGPVPATDAARAWSGWGTALKPAWEPILLARKPLAGTVAANVQTHGTGALNIDGCRVGFAPDDDGRWGSGRLPGGFGDVGAARGSSEPNGKRHDAGRWPANVLLDEEAAALLDAQSGERGGGFGVRGASTRIYGDGRGLTPATGEAVGYGDTGGASRFFYTAKASRADRTEGNTHPTVKPVEIMRWLVRLVCARGGLVLDPFAGSGTTGVACVHEGARFVGIEREPEFVEIARRRLQNQGGLFAWSGEASA